MPNRIYHDRSDALDGLAHHIDKMIEHRRHAAEIIHQFHLDIGLPPVKPLRDAGDRAAALRRG